MPRYSLLIEYDGGPYCGWQIQDKHPSVQAAVEQAALKIDGAFVRVYGSGRTDSGVHALGQIAHMDMVKNIREDKLRDAMNYHLGDHPITILDAQMTDDDFHARFDATEREYLYRIIDRRPKLALDRGRLWRIPQKLDVEAMHHAAQILVGEHDFSTFRDKNCQAKSPIKTLDIIRVSRIGDEIHVTVKARSFLHRMVRSIVGCLAEVGTGKWDASDMKAALESRDRKQCGPVSPPDGLYLVAIKYAAYDDKD